MKEIDQTSPASFVQFPEVVHHRLVVYLTGHSVKSVQDLVYLLVVML